MYYQMATRNNTESELLLIRRATASVESGAVSGKSTTCNRLITRFEWVPTPDASLRKTKTKGVATDTVKIYV